MIKNISHVGIFVKDLDDAVDFFEKNYGAKVIWRKKFQEMKLESAFVEMGTARFELSAGLDSESMVSKYIDTSGPGLHHVSLEVDQFDQTLHKFREKGLKIVAEEDTEDFKAAFLHPASNLGILTEVIEPKEGSPIKKVAQE